MYERLNIYIIFLSLKSHCHDSVKFHLFLLTGYIQEKQQIKIKEFDYMDSEIFSRNLPEEIADQFINQLQYTIFEQCIVGLANRILPFCICWFIWEI